VRSPENPGVACDNREWFATTHWSVVLSVREKNASAGADALEVLCRSYWYPLYAYVRRRGYSPEDAQDLTQTFFERLLAKDFLRNVDREKGKFRSFLLASLNHFLSDEKDRANRQKRGGGRIFLSLDAQEAEERYRIEPHIEATAERIYERRWAFTVLELVLQRLASEYEQAGKAEQFSLMKEFLQGENPSYTEVATNLGMTEGALRVAVHRMRQRFGELLKWEIAQTVASPAEIDEELNHFFQVLST
jgi:RNA polymerase sigma factor (sigma-70 family)